jgi:glycerol-3-phosphate cytidylyltransferase
MSKPVIVYTSGVYDMFHVGHLNILKAAKGLGDKLIVAVSTDEVVESYKPGSLVVPFKQRVQIISALSCVDVCIAQTDRDKFKAWERLNYDILVHGDDWFGKEEYIVYEKKLRSVGAKVVYLPYTPDVSSSHIRSLLEKRGLDKHVRTK